MNNKYSIATLFVGLLYAIVIEYPLDFPVSEEVFQTILFYLVIKVFGNDELPAILGTVKHKFFPEPVKVAKKK